MRADHEEIDKLLRPFAAALAHEADAILDLRDLLARKGHPGKCVRCFFRLFEAAGDDARQRLDLLKAWLEQNLEITIRSGETELEALPLRLSRDTSLEEFCLRSITNIQMDRTYAANAIQLAFRYKAAAA